VRIVEREPAQPESCENDVYSCVPGGALLDFEHPDGDFHSASGCIFAEKSGTRYFLTSAHNLTDKEDWCDVDPRGQEVYQGPDEAKKIGEAKEVGWNQDYASIEPTTDKDITGFDNTIIGEYSDVEGYVTKDGLDEMKDSNATAHRYGMATCHESGEVDRISDQIWCDNEGKWVVITADSDGGDSGGPHYREFSFEGVISIIGVHHGSAENALSCPAYILNDRGYEFGGSSSC